MGRDGISFNLGWSTASDDELLASAAAGADDRSSFSMDGDEKLRAAVESNAMEAMRIRVGPWKLLWKEDAWGMCVASKKRPRRVMTALAILEVVMVDCCAWRELFREGLSALHAVK